MKSKIKLLLTYFLTWVVFFGLLRLVFLIYQQRRTAGLSRSDTLLTFWYGLRMDSSMASYILLPVCLFLIAALWIPLFRRSLIYTIYTYIVLFWVLLISLCDLEMYKEWGFRIDSSPLKFLNTPSEALSSIEHLPITLILTCFLVCYILFLYGFRFVLRKYFFAAQERGRGITLLVLLILTGALIIPIRGGLQQAPLNQSSVYFSTNNYANHAAINASWNFMHSLLANENNEKNPYQYLGVKQDRQIVDSLYSWVYMNEPLIKFGGDTPTNVIVVIWESFTEKAIHVSREGEQVTPDFNRLLKEGIYFSNVYASGDRTNKGVPAVLSGYPAMPGTSIIHSPGKSGKLSVISQLFKEKGYATPFFYGGEPEFANIKSYLLHGGFDPIVGKNDFDQKDMNSKWGAHDGVVMERIFRDLNKSPKPFFATWLTLSSHEPYETPVPVVIRGSDMTSRFLNTLHYTDHCVAELIEKCSREPWWNNTVMIITGDHGHPLPETNSRADNFRIPMLWIGGALKKKGIVINKVVSQLDIAATVAQQAGLDARKFPFSKNMLDAGPKEWAFFTFNNGFGFINPSGRLLYDNVGNRPISEEGKIGTKEISAGKAMQQLTFQDYLDK